MEKNGTWGVLLKSLSGRSVSVRWTVLVLQLLSRISQCLYRSALAARPVGHLDRPSTFIQLTGVHSARFKKQRDKVERARAEAMEPSPTDSYEARIAALVLQLRAGCRAGPVYADGNSSAECDSTSYEDPWILSVQLLHRFERFGEPTCNRNRNFRKIGQVYLPEP
ncbi:hypothetical protein HD554DRAFT_2045862 [Boletus coccyginus]|nr:hypothetical protein HD554DRAFT_2045862 [Boletus coccyginus]